MGGIRIGVGRGVLAVTLLASAAHAGIFNLQDGNSTARFNTDALAPGSRVGLDQWTVDGTNHIYSQWFWIRADGDAREQRINSLPEILARTSDTNGDGIHETLFLRYGSTSTYTVETTFGLQGGSAGDGTSDITEQIRVTNRGSTTRHFSFFQYCDMDLGGDAADDFVAVINANAVRQADNAGSAKVSETILTPTYTHAEVGVYPSTLNRLDDAGVDTLGDVLGPFTSRADYTWAFQWDFTLGPGQSFLISKDKQITPAPGTLAAGVLASALGLRRRR